ncbi:MAG: hypothetical protein MZV63_14110 [Marinilabiliales bacterium]|nr:hypothetical protein [Marinilabiliales bacterium]
MLRHFQREDQHRDLVHHRHVLGDVERQRGVVRHHVFVGDVELRRVGHGDALGGRHPARLDGADGQSLEPLLARYALRLRASHTRDAGSGC